MTALIPSLGETPDTEDWSTVQINSFIACTYLILGAYLAVLILAVANFFQFIITKAKSQSGHTPSQVYNHPLMVFYILVALCILFDMLYSFYIVSIETQYSPFLPLMPPTLKVLIGIDQIWMVIEFIFHLKFSIKVAQGVSPRGKSSRYNALSLSEKNHQKQAERTIRIGRCIITLLILAIVATIIGLCVSKLGESEADFEADETGYSYFFIIAFSMLFVGLLTTVLLLKKSMRDKDHVLQERFGIQIPLVRTENCILFTILMVFNLSYVLRVSWELVPFDDCTSF